MISLTPLAQEKLTTFLVEKKLGLQVRITCSSGDGGDGEQLILVPDKPASGDLRAGFGPLILCLSRDLYDRVGRVRVDYRVEDHDYGFVVERALSPADLGDCAGCTACG